MWVPWHVVRLKTRSCTILGNMFHPPADDCIPTSPFASNFPSVDEETPCSLTMLFAFEDTSVIYCPETTQPPKDEFRTECDIASTTRKGRMECRFENHQWYFVWGGRTRLVGLFDRNFARKTPIASSAQVYNPRLWESCRSRRIVHFSWCQEKAMVSWICFCCVFLSSSCVSTSHSYPHFPLKSMNFFFG